MFEWEERNRTKSLCVSVSVCFLLLLLFFFGGGMLEVFCVCKLALQISPV